MLTSSPSLTVLGVNFFLHIFTYFLTILISIGYPAWPDTIYSRISGIQPAIVDTIYPRSSYFYIVTYYIKWVTNLWTHSIKDLQWNFWVKKQKLIPIESTLKGQGWVLVWSSLFQLFSATNVSNLIKIYSPQLRWCHLVNGGVQSGKEEGGGEKILCMCL